MLSKIQIDQFAGFGFTVLRDHLGERALPLRHEVDAAIRDAYAATYDERVIDGISGHYLPMASQRTPTSASLICDDRRLIDAAEDLLGGPVIPECPEGVLYFAEAGWHNDDGIGVRGVKFATYFDLLFDDAGITSEGLITPSRVLGRRVLHINRQTRIGDPWWQALTLALAPTDSAKLRVSTPLCLGD